MTHCLLWAKKSPEGVKRYILSLWNPMVDGGRGKARDPFALLYTMPPNFHLEKLPSRQGWVIF